MQKFDLKTYARAGAKTRLAELDAERAQILATFPDFRIAERAEGRRRKASVSRPARKRRMSAEARRRISEAQKKRWAAQKAKK